MVKQGQQVTITVGDSSYAFNPKTAELSSASWKGKEVLSGIQPTIWRPLTGSESGIVKHSAGLKEQPDLNRFTAQATSWKLEQLADRVQIHATALCTIDDKNHFTASYDYTIDNTGEISIHYSYLPVIQMPWLPQVGLSVALSPAVKQLSWLGLGPLDTFPNENMAGVLGVYSGPIGSDSIEGNKTTRWVEVQGNSLGVRFENRGYMRIDAKHPSTVDLLSAVLGRTSKGRRPEDPDQQLNVTGKPFVGQLSFRLHQ